MKIFTSGKGVNNIIVNQIVGKTDLHNYKM